MQISGFLLHKALIVLRQLCWFYLLVYIVNIRGIQHIGLLPLNSKVNKSEISAEHLLPPQVSIQWPSRISISMQRQHSGEESLQAYSWRQTFLNLSSVYLLSSVSLPLSINYSLLYYASLHCRIFRYSLILFSYGDQWLFMPIAFCNQYRSIIAKIQPQIKCYISCILSQGISSPALQLFAFSGRSITSLIKYRSSFSSITVSLLKYYFHL